MRHRMYDPRTGRFTQTDPILGLRPTNHYSYGYNNPVSVTDHMGTSPDMMRYLDGGGSSDYSGDVARAQQQELAFVENRVKELGSDFWFNATGGYFGQEEFGKYNARRIEIKNKTQEFKKIMAGEAGVWMNTITSMSPQGIGSRAILGEDYITQQKLNPNEQAIELTMVLVPFAAGQLERSLVSGMGAARRVESGVAREAEATAVAGSSDRVANRFLASRPVVAPGTKIALGSERVSSEGMQSLANTFEQEVSQIYIYGPGKNGGGGSYSLIVGDQTTVKFQAGPDVMWIGHTHPGGRAGPSTRDIGALDWLQQLGSPQRKTSIWYKGGSEPVPFTTSTPVVPE